MNRISALLLAFVLTFSLVSCGSSPAMDETTKGDGVLKIGAILPLQGSGASLGNYVKNAIDLALSEQPQEIQDEIKIFYEDDEWRPSRTVAAFQKLSNIDDIDIVFTLGSASGNAIGPIAEEAGIPMVAIGASDPNVVKGKKYAFKHWILPETEAEVFAKEVRKRGYERLALVSVQQEGVIAMVEAVKEALAEDDIIVADERLIADVKDFNTVISKLKELEVDSICPLLFPAAIAEFAKKTRELNLDVPLPGLELYEDSEVVKASSGALIGQWYVNADSPSGEFMKKYEEKYGTIAGFGTGNAYDVFNITIDAYKKYGDDKEKITEHFSNLKDYNGVMGTYSAKENSFAIPGAVKIVKEDGFEELYDEE